MTPSRMQRAEALRVDICKRREVGLTLAWVGGLGLVGGGGHDGTTALRQAQREQRLLGVVSVGSPGTCASSTAFAYLRGSLCKKAWHWTGTPVGHAGCACCAAAVYESAESSADLDHKL